MPTNTAVKDILLGGDVAAPPAAPPASPAASRAKDMLLGGQPQTMPDFMLPDPVDDPSVSPRLGTLAKMSLGTTREAQRQFVARQMFPTLSDDERKKRVFFQNDEMVVRQGNRLIRVVPEGWGLNDLGRQAAASAADTGEALAAAGGGLLTLPVAAGIPGAILSAMGARAGRQGLSEQVIGQQYTPLEKAGEIGSAGVLGAAAEAGGAALSRGVQRLASRAIPEVRRLADVAKASLNNVKTRDLVKAAEKFGITLTPAEISRSGELAVRQRVLQNLPKSAEIIQDFLRIRDDQTATAVADFLKTISPEGSTAMAGRMTRDAAQSAIEQANAARAAQASPLYQRAFQSGAQVDLAPVLATLDEQIGKTAGSMKAALQSIRKEMVDAKGAPRGDLEYLHNLKMEIDDKLGKYGTEDSLGKTAKRKVLEVKDALLAQMDDASPDYQQARRIFEQGSPAVSELQHGIVGKLAGSRDVSSSGHWGVDNLAATIFRPQAVDPVTVRAARDAIEAADPEAWRAIVRSHLQNVFENMAETRAAGLAGARFSKAVFGSPRRRAILYQAMTPDQYANLKALMDVLDATGRVFRSGESITAFAGEAMKDFAKEAAGPIPRVFGAVTSPLDVGKSLTNWWTEVQMGRHAQQIAEAITSPQGMKALRKIRTLSPTSRKAVTGVATLLGFRLGQEGIEAGRDATGL